MIGDSSQATGVPNRVRRVHWLRAIAILPIYSLIQLIIVFYSFNVSPYSLYRPITMGWLAFTLVSLTLALLTNLVVIVRHKPLNIVERGLSIFNLMLIPCGALSLLAMSASPELMYLPTGETWFLLALASVILAPLTTLIVLLRKRLLSPVQHALAFLNLLLLACGTLVVLTLVGPWLPSPVIHQDIKFVEGDTYHLALNAEYMTLITDYRINQHPGYWYKYKYAIYECGPLGLACKLVHESSDHNNSVNQQLTVKVTLDYDEATRTFRILQNGATVDSYQLAP